MGFQVRLTEGAIRDLEGIYNYIAEHDTVDHAVKVIMRIKESVAGLAEFPDRGVYPKELLILGIREYREIFFKPYRIIYRVMGEVIRVHLIADGRRDMRSLLQRRLLSP